MVREMELVPSTRGGGAGPDLSDDLKEMRYAEKLVCNCETLASLARREVLKSGDTKYKYTLTDLDELKEFGMDASTTALSSCARMVNAMFVAMEIPFFSRPHTSAEIEKTSYTGKAGSNKGKVTEKRIPDLLKIHKYADEWNPSEYACLEGKIPSKKYVLVEGVKVEKYKVQPGQHVDPVVLKHEEPTIGVRKRVVRWLREVGAEKCPDILRKLEIDEVHIKRLEEKANIGEKALEIENEEIETGEKEE